MSENGNNIKKANIEHIAFIMDGNGRWAEKRGLPREHGHKYGAKALKKVVRRCSDYGINTATFYAFSTENWKRPKREVDAIMDLLDSYLDEVMKETKDNRIRYKFIGDMSVLAEHLQKKISEIEEKTVSGEHTVNIALNYGSKNELVSAYNKLSAKGKKVISEQDIEDELYTADSPALDLLVRTGGELRLSNFLLWQAAYAELYFTDVLWPDMDENAVDDAIETFMNRKRRFGGI